MYVVRGAGDAGHYAAALKTKAVTLPPVTRQKQTQAARSGHRRASQVIGDDR